MAQEQLWFKSNSSNVGALVLPGVTLVFCVRSNYTSFLFSLSVMSPGGAAAFPGESTMLLVSLVVFTGGVHTAAQAPPSFLLVFLLLRPLLVWLSWAVSGASLGSRWLLLGPV